MRSSPKVQDMSIDVNQFDLPSCASELSRERISGLDQTLPDPQPFVRAKSSPQDFATTYKFIRACKAATGKAIVAYEPAKWSTTMEEREESVALTAMVFLQEEGN